jgi:hypothetical protein
MWKHESWYEIPLAYTNDVTTIKIEKPTENKCTCSNELDA